MKKVTAVLLGAGGRGILAYSPYALERPDEIQFVAVNQVTAVFTVCAHTNENTRTIK